MHSFDYQLTTKLVFGPNRIEQLGALAKDLGAARALVVTDPSVSIRRVDARLRETGDPEAGSTPHRHTGHGSLLDPPKRGRPVQGRVVLATLLQWTCVRRARRGSYLPGRVWLQRLTRYPPTSQDCGKRGPAPSVSLCLSHYRQPNRACAEPHRSRPLHPGRPGWRRPSSASGARV